MSTSVNAYLAYEQPQMAAESLGGLTLDSQIQRNGRFGRLSRAQAVYYRADGNDGLEGGNGHDVIFGGRGDDNINGGEGNDEIFGRANGNPWHLRHLNYRPFDAPSGYSLVNQGSAWQSYRQDSEGGAGGDRILGLINAANDRTYLPVPRRVA